MGQIDKNMKNELFKVAIDYIYQQHLVNSQGELAEKIGISTSALSRIMNNKKFVGDDTLRKMNEAFGGIFNMAYFRGESVVMLMEDVAHYKSHPGELDKMINGNDKSDIDQSSLVNAALAAKDETIAALREQLALKDDLIAALRQHIQTLQQQINTFKAEDILKDYPFEHGVAEQRDKPSAHV